MPGGKEMRTHLFSRFVGQLGFEWLLSVVFTRIHMYQTANSGMESQRAEI